MQYEGNLIPTRAKIVNLPPSIEPPSTNVEGLTPTVARTSGSQNDNFTSYSFANGDSVTRINGARRSWTYGDVYSYTSGETLTEFCGQKKDVSFAWTQSYFLGGKLELTCGVSLAISFAPKGEIALAPLNTSFKTGAGLSFTFIDDHKIKSNHAELFVTSAQTTLKVNEAIVAHNTLIGKLNAIYATKSEVAADITTLATTCSSTYSTQNTVSAIQNTVNSVDNRTAGLVKGKFGLALFL